jgi:hypothetical protein
MVRRCLGVEKFCEVLKSQQLTITTEESGQGPEVVFWQKVAWWSLPNNLKGKYAIGSTIEVGKLCDDFQQLSKDPYLTVEYQSDFKAKPSTRIIGKKFVWRSLALFKVAYDLFEGEVVCS